VDPDRNRDSLLRFYDAFNRRDIGVIAETVAEDLVANVTEELGLGQGRDAFVRYWQLTVEALPDARIEVLETAAEGDVVAARYRGTGTYRREFAGIPALGRSVDLEADAFWHFIEDGEVDQYWTYVDNLALLQQLGAIPEDVTG
jgi:steroid delta-isomerase-like uncharacterized protein